MIIEGCTIYTHFVNEYLITTMMATILDIALIGVLVISTAVASHAYAAGGLMLSVGYGAQDSNSQTSNNPLGAIVPVLSGH